jgi:superoxide dismutase, Fe-Mn family
MESSHSWIIAVSFCLLGSLAAMAQSEAPRRQIELPPLPYPEDALAPTISARTMSFHYGKHHKAYVDNINKLIASTPFADLSLEEIVKKAADNPKDAAIFNNAAQAWNHAFFWKSMKPNGGGKPTGQLAELIDKSFGGLDKFKTAFVDAAVGRFGSGWAWLVLEDGKLKVMTTSNAELPRAAGQTPLLTCRTTARSSSRHFWTIWRTGNSRHPNCRSRSDGRFLFGLFRGLQLFHDGFE